MSKPSMLTRNLRSQLAGGNDSGTIATTTNALSTSDRQAEDLNAAAAVQDYVVKSGWLYRRNKRHSWKRRWFVLRDDQLTFYKDEREYKVEGIIPTIDIMSASLISDGNSIAGDHSLGLSGGTHFAVFTSNHNLHFKADNSVDAQDWIEIIRTTANQAAMSSSFKREETLLNGGHAGASEAFQATIAAQPLQPEGISFPASFSTSKEHDHPIVASPSAFSGSYDAFSGTSSNHSEENLPGAANNASRSVAIKDIPPLDLHEETVIQVGYLLRLHRRWNKWVKQWVVLTSERVLFYKDDLQEHLYKVIDLKTIADVVDIDPLSRSKQYCLQIIAPEKRMKFCCDSEELLAQWLASFKLALGRVKR